MCLPPAWAFRLSFAVYHFLSVGVSALTVFFRRLLVIDCHCPTFALAQGVASAAPTACLLVAVARRMQDLANGFFGDMRQSLLTQRLPQCHQRPRRRLILSAIGWALHFRQDTRLLLAGVRRLAPSSRRYV